MNQTERRDKGLLYRTDDALVEQLNEARRLLQKLNSMDRSDVSVCCFTYKPILGNLHESSFDEIWNSPRAEALRTLVRLGEYIDTPCIGCDTGHPVFTRELELGGSLESYWQMSINAR